ncbi:MAG: GspH/FimT family pseudopilin [Acidiferrobacterales bacterium]
MRLNSCQRSDTGFTLIDLIVALVVAGVLLTIAVPSMHDFIQDSRITTNTNEIVLSLSLARTQAVTRHTTVSLCASDDGIDCTATDWELGWIVFTDNGVLGAVDADDIVLHVQQALGGGGILTGPDLITYEDSGMLVAACENCTDGDFSSRGSGSTTARSSVGNIAGRMLLAILGINDAMADPPGNNGGGEPPDTGGFDSGCSDQTASNSEASENCNAPGAGGGGGGIAGAALFTVCDNRAGETGRGVNVSLSGRARTLKLACE